MALDNKTKKVHNVEFKFAGSLHDYKPVTLAIYAQYEAVEMVHRGIVTDIQFIYQQHAMSLSSARNWPDEVKRAEMASFIRNRLVKRNAVADKMYDNGNLTVTLEIVEPEKEEAP